MKIFAWIASELLQNRRPNCALLFADICMMCYNSRETYNRLFRHCEMAWRLWCWPFDIFNLSLVAPPLDCFLCSSIRGFEIRMKAKPSWKCALFHMFIDNLVGKKSPHFLWFIDTRLDSLGEDDLLGISLG